MKRCLALIATVLCLAPQFVRAANSAETVLVAARHSPVARLTVADARRLFLGLPLRVQGQQLKPIHNDSDGLTREIFMQRVLFMTTEEYGRHMETLARRGGGSAPVASRQLGELIEALQADPLAVSYMSRQQATAGHGLKIIGEP